MARRCPPDLADEAALQATLAGPNPVMQILAVGTIALVVIVWLMVMKPF